MVSLYQKIKPRNKYYHPFFNEFQKHCPKLNTIKIYVKCACVEKSCSDDNFKVLIEQMQKCLSNVENIEIHRGKCKDSFSSSSLDLYL